MKEEQSMVIIVPETRDCAEKDRARESYIRIVWTWKFWDVVAEILRCWVVNAINEEIVARKGSRRLFTSEPRDHPFYHHLLNGPMI